MSLFYPNYLKSYLMGYGGVCHLSYPHSGWSQTWYLFTCGCTM